MRVVIQRVSEASVSIQNQISEKIQRGLLVLLGITEGDTSEDIDWLVRKITKMRIFPDTEGKMNLCLSDIAGELLIVSQFTLYANSKKGNRPSFIRSAHPDTAIPLYNEFLTTAAQELGKPCASGEFGADMQITLINDGPITITMDSKDRE